MPGELLVQVGVVELLSDRLERRTRGDEVDGDVVALELLRFKDRFDAVRVAVQRLGPALVIDQVVRGQGITGIARELAALLKRPVVLHDALLRTLAGASKTGARPWRT